MTLKLARRVRAACETNAAAREWLRQLPERVNELTHRWQLTLGAAFDGGDVSCAWVAPALRSDGSNVVLKLALPHFEGKHEIAGLRFWNGDPTVRLLEADEERDALLLESCEPGSSLRSLPEPEQDLAIASALRRLWQTPPAEHPFRPLSQMLKHWADEALASRERWPDAVLIGEGLRLFEELSLSDPDDVVLATDLHAGNVLRAARRPWLVIDPKPFLGDRAYDATQHLLNCRARLTAQPQDTLQRLADLVDLDPARLRLWTFARLAVESSRDSPAGDAAALARKVLR